ncbi:hypothetical protein QR680_010816 [Steinernema hermaphroditum]|uniref:Uncharacterized protein n=1 Tax=Steinernema hermaphroditum TaxID=289476 RepID=A0AA39IQ78_9BILA|nr:hypothetical protein QR680_010816 [Steinernema hermaphroditum]
MDSLKESSSSATKIPANAHSLLDSCAKYLVLNHPFADLTPLPSTVKVFLRKTRSLLAFRSRYEDLRPSISEECFRFASHGSIDFDRTMEQAELRLEPGEAFQLCCAFGLVDRLKHLWEKCQGFGQDDLLHHNCFFFRYFAELANNGRPNAFFTSKRMFKYAMEKRWDTVAVLFYRKMEADDRRTFLIEQWLKTVYTMDPFERSLECAFLQKLLSHKDFKIGREDIEGFLKSRGLVTVPQMVKLPEACRIQEIGDFLNSTDQDKLMKEELPASRMKSIATLDSLVKNSLLRYSPGVKQ